MKLPMAFVSLFHAFSIYNMDTLVRDILSNFTTVLYLLFVKKKKKKSFKSSRDLESIGTRSWKVMVLH